MSDRFKPLMFDETNVGRRIKSTKKRFTWKFELDGNEHKIDFFVSRLSGKRSILLDGDMKHKTKHAGIGVTYPIKMNRDILLIVQNGELEFDLRVNSVSFSKMMYQKRHEGARRKNPPAPVHHPEESEEPSSEFLTQQIAALRQFEEKKRQGEGAHQYGDFYGGQDEFAAQRPKQKRKKRNQSSDQYGGSDPFAGRDPFANNNRGDPFGSSGNQDPFGNSNQDPFSTSSNRDPFASNTSDPFASNKNTTDPFSNQSNNPFGDSRNEDPFAGRSTDPFRAEEQKRRTSPMPPTRGQDETRGREQPRQEQATRQPEPAQFRTQPPQKQPNELIDLLDTPINHIPANIQFSNSPTSQGNQFNNSPQQNSPQANPFDTTPQPQQNKPQNPPSNDLFNLDFLGNGDNFSPAMVQKHQQEQQPTAIVKDAPNVPMNQQFNTAQPMMNQQMMTGQMQMMQQMMQANPVMYQQYMTNMMQMMNNNQYQGGHK